MITSCFQEIPSLELYKKQFLKDKKITFSGLANAHAKAFFLSQILNLQKKTVLISVDIEHSYDLIKHFPLWTQTPLFLFDTEKSEKEQLRTLLQWYEKEEGILCLPFSSYQTKVPEHSTLKNEALSLSQKKEISLIECIEFLLASGYEKKPHHELSPGEFCIQGDTLTVFSLQDDAPVSCSFAFDSLEEIRKNNKKLSSYFVYPALFPKHLSPFSQGVHENFCVIADEIEEHIHFEDDFFDSLVSSLIHITAFPRENEEFIHLRYLSVLNFYSFPDFFNDLQNKIAQNWKTVIYSKRPEEIEEVLKNGNIPYTLTPKNSSVIQICPQKDLDFSPISFQNPDEKIALITDKEIFTLKKTQKNQSISKLNIDFISSLKEGDLVIHFDHGIGRFEGIIKNVRNNASKEYLRIVFRDNDVLFVPVENADKINKYIYDGEANIELSKMGGAEWQKQMKKAHKETEKMAKELLALYAKREQQKREPLLGDKEEEQKFAKTFPYDETPGQIKAITDVQKDLEGSRPMDRLVCGDVGFGKTEVAMRASFKAVKSGKQVALISPITILSEQHYQSFYKRMHSFGIRIGMMSRFQSEANQKKTLEDMRKGNLDIVIGTHRLLQDDIKFLNLGLLIIDEEQRFGVQQKETLKKLKSQVDVLTLTATPIPRTLHLSLNNLRDITTITTPPPGRLPIITEVRRYSPNLVQLAIENELARNGQVFFLHNRVETIESMAERIRSIVPKARCVVAHGQMSSKELEERIRAFKAKEYDVLISSTIIENGIDLANANTMLINNADRFGLSQLYQLRGRIGRSSRQAYAYLLYQKQKLSLDAKRRLRALVEASDLGAGFQIALRDLEIRGAGEILGSAQHGSMAKVGVSHFLRLLQKTIKEMQDGTFRENQEEEIHVSIDIPIEAFIPSSYISDAKSKISTYQKLASVDSLVLLKEFEDDIFEEFGPFPTPLKNLFDVLRLKYYCAHAGISKVSTLTLKNYEQEIQLLFAKTITPDRIVKALEQNPHFVITGNALKIHKKYLGHNFLQTLVQCTERMAII
jgi:transcription-repair coupling factor